MLRIYQFRGFFLLLLLLLLGAACRNATDESGNGVPTLAVAAGATPTLDPEIRTRVPYRAFTPGVPPTVTPTPTPTGTPTPTPEPLARLGIAESHMLYENYTAAEQELAAGLIAPLLPEQKRPFYLLLVQLYLAQDKWDEAEAALDDYQAAGGEDSVQYLYLGQINNAFRRCETAIQAYEQYLAANSHMAAYVQPEIADCYFGLGDEKAAVEALQAAADPGIPAHPTIKYGIQYRLALYYRDSGQYSQAIDTFSTAQELALTESDKGTMAYQAGYAAYLAGDEQAAYEWYVTAVYEHPRSYDSYLALRELVNADYPVDLYQRAVVNYWNGQRDLAISQFYQYLAANTVHNEEAHLYIARGQHTFGNSDAAIAELESMLATPGLSRSFAADAQWELSRILAASGRYGAAGDQYAAFVEQYPEHSKAPFAAWWAAANAEWRGDYSLAESRYLQLVKRFGWHADAPEAYYQAGLMAEEQGALTRALYHWRAGITAYPQNGYSHAALLRLLPYYDPALLQTASVTVTTMLSGDLPLPAVAVVIDESALTTGLISGTAAISELQGIEMIAATTPAALTTFIDQLLLQPEESYYSLRAQQLLDGGQPFQREPVIAVYEPQLDEQRAAEQWLRQQFDLAPAVNLNQLSTELAADGRLLVGSTLWELGMKAEARLELEALRQAYADDPVASYQLALYFRDLGLYRSSIIAARTVLDLADATIFTAPVFLGKLVYPVYYAELIESLAVQYGYDPFLQFALVRQESLYESFATSGAAAKGLSQVIPATGDYIALRLGWPEYRTEDLYRPYVGLHFGAYYLDQQLDGFNGAVYPALAAYNAGPGNAQRWYLQAGSDPDQYLAVVNFAETRLYIERIFTGYESYQYLYSGAAENVLPATKVNEKDE